MTEEKKREQKNAARRAKRAAAAQPKIIEQEPTDEDKDLMIEPADFLDEIDLALAAKEDARNPELVIDEADEKPLVLADEMSSTDDGRALSYGEREASYWYRRLTNWQPRS